VREAAARVKAASQASAASASAAQAVPQQLLDVVHKAATPVSEGGLPRNSKQVG